MVEKNRLSSFLAIEFHFLSVHPPKMHFVQMDLCKLYFPIVVHLL